MRYLLAALVLGAVLLPGGLGARTPPSSPAPAGPLPIVRAQAVGGWRAVAIHAVASLAMVALLGLAAALFFENSFVFRPSRRPATTWDPPVPGAEECFFRTRDGLRLHAWWHPGDGPSEASVRPVLLWCHGNAGNVTHRADLFAGLAGHGMAVLLFDYRGYGQSEGRPSEPGLYADAEAAYDYLTVKRGVAASRVICFGRSLGSAVALHVALRKPAAGVVLEGAISSVAAVAAHHFLSMPFALLLRNEFDAVNRARRLRAPLLVIHGSRDRVVPPRQGREVFRSASEPKEFYLVLGAGHEDAHLVDGDRYYQTVRQFCEGCVAQSPAGRAAPRA